jgi:WD40 repeat protein
MTESENFYTSGGTLGRSARSYVTRRADDDLLRHMLNGDFCYVLTSRQVGKSSLMVRIADTLRKQGVNVAILDLTRIGQNVSLEQWYDGLLVRLGADLNLEDELDDYWTSDGQSRMGPMQRFMGALREVVLPAIKGKISIFIDEIDSVKSLPFSSDEFFAGLRECYNRRVGDPEFKRLSFCLLGVAQPSDLISNVYITPFNIGHRIELTDFSETEAQPLLEGLRSKSTRPKGPEAILQRILYWTGGHPYLTQKLCETIGQLDKDVTPRDVDLACSGLFLSSRSREQQDNLIFVRDRVLASKEHRAAILDLYEKVLRGAKIRDDDSNATIDPLRLSGLLTVSSGYLKVRNRIYATVFDRHWITANMPDAELQRQKAAYRRGIIFALGISLPVLAVITFLGFVDIHTEREAVHDGYFAAASSAQDSFNAGDYGTGKEIIGLWSHEGLENLNWWKRLGHRWEDWYQDREDLENSFAMRLLKVEASASFSKVPLRQEHSPESPHQKDTSCDSEIAVATARLNGRGRPLIAAAGADSSVQIWYSDTEPMQPFAHLQLESQDGAHSTSLMSCGDVKNQASKLPGIMSLSFSSDGSKLAIGTGTWRNAKSRGSVLLWDMNHQDSVAPLPNVSFEKTVDWVQFSDDGQYLAASSEDGTAEIWTFSNGVPSNHPTPFDPRRLVAPDRGSVGGSGAYVVALSSVAKHLMAIGYGDGHLVIYDFLHPASPLYIGVAHVSGVMSLVFLEQKGKDLRLAVGSRDGDLLLMDPYGGTVKATLHTDQGVLQGLAVGYSEDTSKAWLLTSGSNGTVGLWAVSPNFHQLLTLRGHTKGVHAAAFCQSTQNPGEEKGCIVSVSSDSDVRLWKYPFRQQTGTHTHLAEGELLFPGQLLGVAFRSGHIVTAVGATTEEGDSHEDSEAVATWDYNLKAPPNEFNPHPNAAGKPMLGFGVSPDGKFLVSSSRDRDLVFVDLKSGVRAQPIPPVHVTLKSKIQIRCLHSNGTGILPERRKDILGGCSTDQREYLVVGVADRGDIADGADNKGNRYDPGAGLCWWHITDHGFSAKERFSIADGDIINCESPVKEPRSRSQQLSDFRDVDMFDISADGKSVATSSDEAPGPM